jgi:hypothetical protein
MTRTHIVIHHSATVDGPTVSWAAIERFHTVDRAWDDIGYHYGVELVAGAGYQALIGRDERQRAAAAPEADMNRAAIHVCCVGNYDIQAPPLDMLRCLVRRVLRPLVGRYRIPVGNVIGHRDVGLMAGFDWRKGQYKSCPGRLFDLGRVRSMLA